MCGQSEPHTSRPGAADNSASRAGAVYVFERSSAGVWTQEAYIKASNTRPQAEYNVDIIGAATGELDHVLVSPAANVDASTTISLLTRGSVSYAAIP